MCTYAVCMCAFLYLSLSQGFFILFSSSPYSTCLLFHIGPTAHSVRLYATLYICLHFSALHFILILFIYCIKRIFHFEWHYIINVAAEKSSLGLHNRPLAAPTLPSFPLSKYVCVCISYPDCLFDIR